MKIKVKHIFLIILAIGLIILNVNLITFAKDNPKDFESSFYGFLLFLEIII